MLAWRRACSPPRALSTSLWKLGTLARSSTCRCAAAARQCCRASHIAVLGGRPHAVCVCWRGAGNVQRRELFRPAFGCMERWSGHQHGCAPPPCVSGSCAHSCSGESGHKPCACAGAAQGMFYFASATYPVSECNRLLTHRSFIAQTPSAWASSNHDSWASASCPFLPPSLPPPPPSPPPLPPPPAGVFRDQGRLKFALGEWRDDAVSAQAAHGHISNWDVSAITDMSQLIGNSAIYSGDDDDDYVHYERVHLLLWDLWPE